MSSGWTRATCTIPSSTGSGTICSAVREWSATIALPETPGVPWPSRPASTSCWATTGTIPRIPGTGASWTRPRSRDGRSSCISATTGKRGMRFLGWPIFAGTGSGRSSGKSRRLESGVSCGGVVRAWRGDSVMQLNTAKRASFDEGSLDQYLREISQYPLITREEEVTLAQRIKQSDAEALDKLVRSNLRFVVSVAKKYQNQGVSLSDLINEGNLGLIRAAHKFDETKGIKFISYAVLWFSQAILQALAEQSRIVRVPLNRAGTLHRIGKRSASLLQELGREPTVEEIAEGMDISEEEVAKTLSISQAHLSLDAPLTPGEDNKLLDYLPDTTNPGPDDEIFEHALTESIESVLATLKEREARILRLYFGLEGQEPMTLEEIGSQLGITRERVRQLKEKALARLRHVSRARALESFLS